VTVGINPIQFNLNYNCFINNHNINRHNVSSLINMLLHKEQIYIKKTYFLPFVFISHSFKGLESLVES